MTKDEALRLALEALEKTQSALAKCIGPHKSEEGDRHRALAYSRTTISAIKPTLEAKDEPFGYFRYDLRLDAWVQSRDSNQGVAFYTTPPQRKPLTNQQIAKILEHGDVAESNDKVGWYVLPYSFARAIEAAHGIKGEA